MRDLKGYKKPELLFINECEARKLYKLEDIAKEAFSKSTEELNNVVGHTKKEYWTHTVPMSLLSLLEGYDTNASIVAAMAFLELKGYVITDKETD